MARAHWGRGETPVFEEEEKSLSLRPPHSEERGQRGWEQQAWPRGEAGPGPGPGLAGFLRLVMPGYETH